MCLRVYPLNIICFVYQVEKVDVVPEHYQWPPAFGMALVPPPGIAPLIGKSNALFYEIEKQSEEMTAVKGSFAQSLLSSYLSM